MRSVLGIDAAWTARGSSGVSLVAEEGSGWHCVAVAPSYDSFIALAGGKPIRWERKHLDTIPNVDALIAACRQLLRGRDPTVVAADIPLSTIPITRRRHADNLISQEFGGRGCGAHTPSPERPGRIGKALSAGFESRDFQLATQDTKCGKADTLLEVYPHPAILMLLDESYRFPYKVSKSNIYWPDLSQPERYAKLTANFGRIRRKICSIISCREEQFPFPPKNQNKIVLARLKPYEDVIDSLVCAWVGIRYLEMTAKAYGDDTAAIWVPVSGF